METGTKWAVGAGGVFTLTATGLLMTDKYYLNSLELGSAFKQKTLEGFAIGVSSVLYLVGVGALVYGLYQLYKQQKSSSNSEGNEHIETQKDVEENQMKNPFEQVNFSENTEIKASQSVDKEKLKSLIAPLENLKTKLPFGTGYRNEYAIINHATEALQNFCDGKFVKINMIFKPPEDLDNSWTESQKLRHIFCGEYIESPKGQFTNLKGYLEKIRGRLENDNDMRITKNEIEAVLTALDTLETSLAKPPAPSSSSSLVT